MTKQELISVFDKLADKFYSNGVPDPNVYIEQISFFLFAKMLDEKDMEMSKARSMVGKEHKSIFDGDNGKFRWRYWSSMPDTSEMFKFVRDELVAFMQTLPNHDDVKRFSLDFRFLVPDAVLLSEIVDEVGKINFSQIDSDVKGDMYEHLTDKLTTAGRIGAFRTPRHIIRTITIMVNPVLGQTILDPACGTAGFLMTAAEYIRANNSKTTLEDVTAENGDKYQKGKGDLLSEQDWNMLENNTFWGFDVSPNAVKIAIMNMVLHGLSAKNVYRRDSLAGGTDDEEQMKWDIILANPPFAGDVALERLRSILPIKAKDSSILFVGLMIESLKQGGTCGVIVNEGLLFGRNKAAIAVRKLLLEKMDLQAVVSLPQGVFNPYAGVKTSFLIFKNTSKPTEKVWFYEVENDGYSKGTQRKPQPSKNDLLDLLSKWPERKVSEKSWVIEAEKIKENDYILSASNYKPGVEGDNTKHREPNKILDEINKLAFDANRLQEDIRKLI